MCSVSSSLRGVGGGGSRLHQQSLAGAYALTKPLCSAGGLHDHAPRPGQTICQGSAALRRGVPTLREGAYLPLPLLLVAAVRVQGFISSMPQLLVSHRLNFHWLLISEGL